MISTSGNLLTNELVTRDNYLTFHKYIGILPNPGKILEESGSQTQVYTTMKSDPHVWSCIQSRKSGVLSLKWEILAKNENSPEMNLVREMFEELDIFNLISNILESIFSGFQVMEILWDEHPDGSFIPKEIVSKPNEWFFFGTDGKIRFRAKGQPKGILLPENKFLVPRHNPTYENPYGEALLTKCYWPVTIKNMGFRFWMNFLEKYGMPLVIGQYTYPPTPEELQALADRLQKLIDSQTIAAPSDISIDIKDIGQSKSVELYSQLIKMANAEISKALLSETLTTEMDSGSFAASVTHFKVRRELILGDVKIVENALNVLIKMLLTVNNLADGQNYKREIPKFRLIE
jgi:phage gp29-like protein